MNCMEGQEQYWLLICDVTHQQRLRSARQVDSKSGCRAGTQLTHTPFLLVGVVAVARSSILAAMASSVLLIFAILPALATSIQDTWLGRIPPTVVTEFFDSYDIIPVSQQDQPIHFSKLTSILEATLPPKSLKPPEVLVNSSTKFKTTTTPTPRRPIKRKTSKTRKAKSSSRTNRIVITKPCVCGRPQTVARRGLICRTGGRHAFVQSGNKFTTTCRLLSTGLRYSTTSHVCASSNSSKSCTLRNYTYISKSVSNRYKRYGRRI